MPNSPNRLNHCIYYAIGDVHGELERLSALHDTMFEHHQLCHPDLGQVIVHLGDYVDRGPDSCGVIEYLMDLEASFVDDPNIQLINLRGNHEQQMLDALQDPDGLAMRTWKREGWGGHKTIESYERRSDTETILAAHCTWIEQLPAIWRPAQHPFVFVHAGVDPDAYPNEEEEIYLWTRSSKFFNTDKWTSVSLQNQTVVHGHTPTRDYAPEVQMSETFRRINVDTGAVYGGDLTCAVIDPAVDEVIFLSA